jgi:endonuclease/exonuclease/phosphatase family metal-dependent hydrolase
MIRLMTYNICATCGIDGQRSLERIIEVIRKAGAQIICLQEVDQCLTRSNMIDQPAVFAESLGMSVAFQGNLQMDSGWYGIAVLTSYEIVSKSFHNLTSIDEQRGALEVGIQTPHGLLTVFCTHFGLEPSEREIQATELAAIVSSVPGSKIVCGDFNEEAGDAGVSRLIKTAYLNDADPDGNLTFDSVNPSCRIDMILYSTGIEIHSVSVLKSQASDHLPLVADISFAP